MEDEDLCIVYMFRRRPVRHHYAATVGKLRMATKYLFHVKQSTTASATAAETRRRASGRADLGVNELGPNGIFLGQSIVIPTKGCMCFVL